jgi:hypothetical protein
VAERDGRGGGGGGSPAPSASSTHMVRLKLHTGARSSPEAVRVCGCDERRCDSGWEAACPRITAAAVVHGVRAPGETTDRGRPLPVLVVLVLPPLPPESAAPKDVASVDADRSAGPSAGPCSMPTAASASATLPVTSVVSELLGPEGAMPAALVVPALAACPAVGAAAPLGTRTGPVARFWSLPAVVLLRRGPVGGVKVPNNSIKVGSFTRVAFD